MLRPYSVGLGHAPGQQSRSGNLAAQYGGHFVGLHRSADQEALCKVAMTAAQEFKLWDGFNAFCRNFDIQSTRHGNRCPDNALVAAVDFDVLDKRLIKHETVDHARIK